MSLDTRREFIKKAALLSGAAGLSAVFPPSILRALSIDPAAGSTFLDAEHVVILMQENRSFDHCFGCLQGVRGFNDPRAIKLPDGSPVWLQKNKDGKTHVPFRLNIKDTKATWMGSLPHTWADQVDARNGGRFDRWLDAKQPTNKEHQQTPLTLGYHNRADLPFYYSLADAFTVCDQNFCSSLTGTSPNRLYLWTGTIRDKPKVSSPARVRNEDFDDNPDLAVRWKTFPELLEEQGVSWKVYQNEISIESGLNKAEETWLANFTDNPLEFFAQYHVHFSPARIAFLPKQIDKLTGEIQQLEASIAKLPRNTASREAEKNKLKLRRKQLKIYRTEQAAYTPENYARLSPHEKNLHQKAFTTNSNDPSYHELTTLSYHDGNVGREMTVPKGDVLHQFREDTKQGNLPAVSWLVAPQNFSDHPDSPFYGAWYVSEAIDILTRNPDVWKKTIFILCYDENDGYFDHIPPFVPPDPAKPGSGLTSPGVDAAIEHVTLAQDRKRTSAEGARASSIGLGYRVPLMIVSPWSRGGCVNSQVFDHTSVLQFLEKFISHKTGQKLKHDNISPWRRTVCGDLTSVFKPYHGEKTSLPDFIARDPFLESIHRAQFKNEPAGFNALTKEEIAQIKREPLSSPLMPRQEKGIRPSCALPYQLYAEASLAAEKRSVTLQLGAGNDIFKERSAGSPFNVYSSMETYPRAYAVSAGDRVTDHWNLSTPASLRYELGVYGPNGFFRSFTGDANDPEVEVFCDYENKQGIPTGNIELKLLNRTNHEISFEISDSAYKHGLQTKTLAPGKSDLVQLDLTSSFGWYDVNVIVAGAANFLRRYAGRVETGESGFTDPVMGGTV